MSVNQPFGQTGLKYPERIAKLKGGRTGSLSSTPVESNTNPVRIKTDSSSSYINYNGTGGPIKFEAIIYGCDWRGLGEKDYTTHYYIYVDGGAKRVDRPRAIVTRGTRGFVRQDVYESGASHAKLKGKYYSGTGTAKGVWSPDSVYEDLGDYNN